MVVTRVENPTDQPAKIKVDVNGAGPAAVDVPAGKTITVQTPIPGSATDLAVKYTGEKSLVILETDFR